MKQRLRIEGLCADRGQFRMQGDGKALVFAVVNQTGGIPYLVCQCFGDGPAAQVAASAAARRLTKGTPVVVHGDGLVLARWQGQDVLRLVGPASIDSPVAVPYCERTSTHEAALAA